ncbi:YjfK family protein [Endozoicomonas sp. ONNA2]|uniref:YjfK family protein n=1 Tax=Endozoicomonas sp. ONNA2 TaxID=2828741 RepID=UPI0021481568|nr:YjfK family protein [Endozoicomonas sp. ONNA2]
MIFDWFKRKKEDESKITSLPSPLNLCLGSALELDLLPFQMIREQLGFSLPEGVQTIEAAGFIDLGMGALLCRFYTADDGFIQISTTGGYETQNIDDIKFFVFAQTHHIASQSGASLWVSDSGLIGDKRFDLDEISYRRVWDEAVPGRIEPVNFTETVHSHDESVAVYEVDHLAMLYQRQISDSERYEYLLASLEFSGEDEATAVVSLGFDLEISSMTIT